MKTPEKEAEDLVNEYRMLLMNEDTECGNEILCTIIAKKCALVAVKKLQQNSHSEKRDEFWQKVEYEVKMM
jgi:hypothetical protein